MNGLNPWHLVLVVVAFMLLFGANKLPQMARSVGQSMRIFKAETQALSGHKEAEQLPPTTGSPAQAQVPQAQVADDHRQERPPVS